MVKLSIGEFASSSFPERLIVLGSIPWDSSIGQTMMVWSVRLAVVCYLLRVIVLLRRSGPSGIPTTGECVLWSLGCLFYIAHVILAFQHVHDWSHQLALEHTASETARLTGLARGEGIWVNYLFTGVWIADVFRIATARWRGRDTSPAIEFGVQFLFAFIVFNATIVFGPPLYRFLAVPVGLLLLGAWLGRKSKPHRLSS